MSETKAILIDLGAVRIKEYDAQNVTIERLEEVFNPTTKETTSKWRFKGYSGSVLSALKSVVRNEYLIDKTANMGLDNYIKQVEESNARILEVMKT